MFRRRSSTDTDAVSTTVDLPAEPVGKGRPTPKRRDAQAARKQRLSPPRNRKEASSMRKERMRDQRTKQREAMAGGGDDRYLPLRDQGTVKKFIRDWVDSRRTIGEYLIPAFVVMFVIAFAFAAYTAYVASFAWVLVLAILAFDSFRVARGVRRAVTERFGADEAKGITMYTLMRSWQMRRLRLPKPAIERGAPV